MNDFLASNLVRIMRDEDGRIRIRPVVIHNITGRLAKGSDFTLPLGGADALREFFRAEEDERLGRWRWPENPDYVVYLVGDDIVDVLRESSVSDEHRGPGRQAGITRDAARTWDNDYSQNFFRAARAFFDAHPEPKPWHDAEPEEVWILTIDGEEVLALIDEDREFHHRSQRRFRSVLDESITAGRRIWPEVTS